VLGHESLALNDMKRYGSFENAAPDNGGLNYCCIVGHVIIG